MRVEKLGPARECGPKIPALTRPAATLIEILTENPQFVLRESVQRTMGKLSFWFEIYREINCLVIYIQR